MNLAYIFLGVLLLFLSSGAQAGTLAVSPGLQPTSLTPVLLLLEDPRGELDFLQVRSPEYRNRFQPWNRPSANFGFTRSTYWAAFTLRNPTDQPVPVVIRQDYPLIDHLDFWAQEDKGNWQRVATGDRLPFMSRALSLRDFVFPVTLPAQSERTYYLRYASQGSLNIGLSVSAASDFLPQLNREQLLLGIYYGGFLVLVIYNLFLFMVVRDRAYVFYMCYAVSYGLFFGVHNGLSYQFIWPGNPWLANHSLLILLGLTLVFGIQFVREVCSGRQLAPRADTLARVLLYFIALLTAIAPFASYRLMIPLFSMLTLIVSLQMLLLGIVCLLRGSVPARYFMAGWVAVVSSVVVYMCKTFGWLPHNGFTQNAFQVAALVEMVLLSMALGARISEMEKRGYTDELSGLHNRRHFDEQLAREFHYASRTGTPLSLLLLDLDHFKSINDRYGHREGDRVIHAIGLLIQHQVRKPVVACRYGGEEFVILLPRTSLKQSSAVAERLVRKVAELEPNNVPLTTSIGVASFEGNNYSAAMQLFEAADAALYRAKQEGRNRVLVSPLQAGQEAIAECSGDRETTFPQGIE